MKIAVLSVSNKGNKLAKSIESKLKDDPTVTDSRHFHKNIKNIIEDAFTNYDAIIAIMATGIVVRSIAPYVQSKTTDPAVLTIDDNGKFVISLLSGHLGGANRLTEKIAEMIKATPVITTSTDVNKRLGIDTLAKDLYLSVINPEAILPVNKAILEAEEIIFYINEDSDFSFLQDYLKRNTLEINVSIRFSKNVPVDEIHVKANDDCLKLRKEIITLGIGCRKGKSKEDIENAISKAVDELNLTVNRIDRLASADIKKSEKGLLEFSESQNIPITFVETGDIKDFNFDNISTSEFVKSKFGIKGVCEPAALIAAGEKSKLIYKKTAFNGVTVAIAVK